MEKLYFVFLIVGIAIIVALLLYLIFHYIKVKRILLENNENLKISNSANKIKDLELHKQIEKFRATLFSIEEKIFLNENKIEDKILQFTDTINTINEKINNLVILLENITLNDDSNEMISQLQNNINSLLDEYNQTKNEIVKIKDLLTHYNLEKQKILNNNTQENLDNNQELAIETLDNSIIDDNEISENFQQIEDFFRPNDNNINGTIIIKGKEVIREPNFHSNQKILFSHLNKEKQELFNRIEKSNDNFFISGKAGTGKSFLLKYFKTNTKKLALYVAPTGIAAININGVTIHSAFGYKNIVQSVSEIRISKEQESLFKRIDTLVIDEISMVRVDTLERIDYILKKINKNNIPFGGKQIILFGDIFQIPPIAKRDEIAYLNNTYGGIYFFNSNAYKNGDFYCIELKEVFRQKDTEYLELLDNVRYGKVTQELIDLLNTRYRHKFSTDIIQLVAKKSVAQSINKFKLSEIETKEYIYKAVYDEKNSTIQENDYPFDFELSLKVGAIVLMVTNDIQKRWVNGTFGKITYLSEDEVKVSIDGIEFNVNPVPIGKRTCVYNRDTNTLEYQTTNIVTQYPLILGYAITIHKSQGSTYSQMACDLNDCFVHGQAYVALSRCTDFKKLFLTSRLESNPFLIDNVLVEFYKNNFEK